MQPSVYVVGTADTKGAELAYVRDAVVAAGVPAVLVDVGTSRAERADGLGVDVTAAEIAGHHPDGADAVLGEDRTCSSC